MRLSRCAYPDKKNTWLHFYFAAKNDEDTGERSTSKLITTAKIQKIFVSN